MVTAVVRRRLGDGSAAILGFLKAETFARDLQKGQAGGRGRKAFRDLKRSGGSGV